jgi:hypothetical protein
MIPGAFPKERRCRKGFSFFWDQFRRDLRALTRRRSASARFSGEAAKRRLSAVACAVKANGGKRTWRNR